MLCTKNKFTMYTWHNAARWMDSEKCFFVVISYFHCRVYIFGRNNCIGNILQSNPFSKFVPARFQLIICLSNSLCERSPLMLHTAPSRVVLAEEIGVLVDRQSFCLTIIAA